MLLKPMIIEQSVVYEPEGSLYHYRVNWCHRHGYRIQRRLASTSDEPNYMFWARSMEVENWIELGGGCFSPSNYCRPVIKLETREEAEAIIRADIATPMASVA